jgi:hypothetical protein
MELVGAIAINQKTHFGLSGFLGDSFDLVGGLRFVP